jgi:NAD(P)-dependent dehydrogenase (short-subunit alcohol dehydrogenase family)
MSIVARLKRRGPNGFGYGTTAEEVTSGLDLHGQTILVTGCNSGLGRETIRALALRGARVIATGRTLERAREGCAGLTGDFLPLACELSEPASVRACIDEVKRKSPPLDAVVCNAGIMAVPTLTQKFGCELQFFTNHIGHFLLVTGLVDRLTPRGRVVVTASEAHRRAPPGGVQLDNLSGERGYAPWTAYGQSKLANILFTKELARRLGDSGGRTANAVHPGVIATNLSRTSSVAVRVGLRLAAPLALKTAAQGAATQTYLATNPAVATVTGLYFADCNPAEPAPIANDAELAARLWAVSETIVASLP